MNRNNSMRMQLNRDSVRDYSYRTPIPKTQWLRDAFLSSIDRTHKVKRHRFSTRPENFAVYRTPGRQSIQFKAAKRTPSNRISSAEIK
uniref:Uncharacterized protein n=1 Tax=Arundo donax TaxID=35708 RepID=A0A0A9G1A6_ARUDO